MSVERTQRVFNFSLNSKINSELKMWETLQKLPKGYGKKLFQSLLEEKFGKPSNPDFERNMFRYLDLDSNIETKIESKVSINYVEQKNVENKIKVQSENTLITKDSLEM